MTDDILEDVFPEEASPQEVQWASGSTDEPTFPEGAWTDKTALVEAPLEGQKYQVKFEGVYWTAITVPPGDLLTHGEMVAVLGRDGTELVVRKQPDRQPHGHLPPDLDTPAGPAPQPYGQLPHSLATPPGLTPPASFLI
ncbi:NfeD family protein [Nodosilinea sp. E11]|nr:NfeD family protein [Nodosilinea sp. E11]